MKMKKTVVFLLALLMLPAFGLASEGQRSDTAAFFDEVVFVGDSLMNQLLRFNLAQKKEGLLPFGEARFLVANSYSLHHASRDKLQTGVNLKYRGREYPLQEALRVMEAKKVFILVGMNDYPGFDEERDVRYWRRMGEQVREAVPGIEVYALSLTPMVKEREIKKLNQAQIDRYNANIEALSREMGFHFVDVATALKNAEGFLDRAMSRDRYVHLSDEAVVILVNSLQDYARTQMSMQVEAE